MNIGNPVVKSSKVVVKKVQNGFIINVVDQQTSPLKELYIKPIYIAGGFGELITILADAFGHEEQKP